MKAENRMEYFGGNIWFFKFAHIEDSVAAAGALVADFNKSKDVVGAEIKLEFIQANEFGRVSQVHTLKLI